MRLPNLSDNKLPTAPFVSRFSSSYSRSFSRGNRRIISLNGCTYQCLLRKAEIDDDRLDRIRARQNARTPKAKRIWDKDEFDLDPSVTGIAERYFAFLLVLAFGLGTLIGTVLIAWIGAKLVANWQRQPGEGQGWQDQIIRARTFVALITGTYSLAIGVLAGWIAREAGSCLWQQLEAASHAPTIL